MQPSFSPHLIWLLISHFAFFRHRHKKHLYTPPQPLLQNEKERKNSIPVRIDRMAPFRHWKVTSANISLFLGCFENRKLDLIRFFEGRGKARKKKVPNWISHSSSHFIPSFHYFGNIPIRRSAHETCVSLFPRYGYFLIDRDPLVPFSLLVGKSSPLHKHRQFFEDHLQCLRYTLFPSADFFYIRSTLLFFHDLFPLYRLRGNRRYSLCFHPLLFPGEHKTQPSHLLSHAFHYLYKE